MCSYIWNERLLKNKWSDGFPYDIIVSCVKHLERRRDNDRWMPTYLLLGLPVFLLHCNCSGRLIFLTEKAGQEALDVHPMRKLIKKSAYK